MIASANAAGCLATSAAVSAAVSWSPLKQLPEAISHDQRRRRQGCCPAPGRSLRHFVDAQQDHRATKQRPEGHDDEQPQENLVFGSQSGEEECVAAIGVITATHPICLSHEGRSFAGLSGVNQCWATMVWRSLW